MLSSFPAGEDFDLDLKLENIDFGTYVRPLLLVRIGTILTHMSNCLGSISILSRGE